MMVTAASLCGRSTQGATTPEYAYPGRLLRSALARPIYVSHDAIP